MRRLLLTFIALLILVQPSMAWSFPSCEDGDVRAVKKLLKAQVKYANRTDFNRFIKTYDSSYLNADGFDIDEYSALIKDIWNAFGNIKYAIDIKNVVIKDDSAIVELTETSFAEIEMSKAYQGELKSKSNTVYYLKKFNGNWKVVADKVLDETTSILYGQAKDLDIKLSAPNNIEPNKEYTATLEFVPPESTIAIASIASDIVEYPQKPTEEVFRPLPEDNVLERLFTSNNKNANEYVIASIGLTKTSVCDLSIKLNLTGFGYAIKRVNVVSIPDGEKYVQNE